MRRLKLVLALFAVALAAFAAGWAFHAYLAPEAVADLANRVFFCQ
jgi:hypothetical protein